ncbi:PAS domain-containing protein [Halolamina sediminis]|uniref:PAS domain-containing protein n=1 Tax=Halolamina sediminis TaxID=1480675 RepID=UPI0006B543F2|nr:PAS domain-containing protein [Halolamina sediminis]
MNEPRDRIDHVLLVMAAGRDRDRIRDRLDHGFGYEVTTATGSAALPAYDICLIGESCLEHCEDALRRRKGESDAYLPHVLLAGESGGEPPRTQVSEAAVDGSPVDEVIALPVEAGALVRRVENLLATRRASVALTERETQYRQLVELTAEAVLLVDEGEIAYANAAAVDLFDAARTELHGSRVTRFVSESEETALTALLDAVPAPGEGASEFVDVGLQTVDGRRIEGSVAGIRVSYRGSAVVQLLVRDRTEARRREDQLRLFGRAVEAAAHGITVADVRADDEPLIYANAGFTRITGYPLGEVLGRNCRFLQGENTDQSAVDRLRAAIDAGEPASEEILNYRRDGTPFWNRLELVPIRDDDGELTHYLGLQRDITEQIRNEQRLAVLDRILRHNVRNKTNVIRGYAETIVEGNADPGAAAERIVDAADELYTISEQVREFDAVVRNTEEAIDAVQLDAVVGEGVAALREEFPAADVQFRASGAVPVNAHPTLRAAIQNLLYQLGDSERPAAEIALVREGDDVRLDVYDRGDAIPREELELVSDRSETPLEHLQGLELWLLRWAVEQSGGEFTLGDADGDPLLRMRFPAADS